MFLAVLLTLLGSWPVVHAKNLLERLHTYDVLHYELEVAQEAAGLRVRGEIELQIRRQAPLRFLISPSISGLQARISGRPATVRLGAGDLAPFEKLIRGLGPAARHAPTLMTVTSEIKKSAGQRLTLEVSYLWTPPENGFAYADERGVQTHLTSFWYPLMADELFTSTLKIKPLRAGDTVLATGSHTGTSEDGWHTFGGKQKQQLLAVFIGDVEHHAGSVPVYGKTQKGLVEDVAAVTALLERWFGRSGSGSFALVVEPRFRPAPSFCAGSFTVLQLPPSSARWAPEFRLSLLAHECAHRWWGHRVPTTVVGDGGTWLREGLAEWTAHRIVREMLGEEEARRLTERIRKFYFRKADLRRTVRDPNIVYANEPSLIDATYIDPPRLPYYKGALVHAFLEWRLGDRKFLEGLRRFAGTRAGRFSNPEDFYFAFGASDRVLAQVRYFAGTNRLPDLVLEDAKIDDGRAEITVSCLDPTWPDGPVLCRFIGASGTVDTIATLIDGKAQVKWSGAGRVRRIVVDPDRILLDPDPTNNVWPRE